MFYLFVLELPLHSNDCVLKSESKFSGMSTSGELALNIDADISFKKLAMKTVFLPVYF